MISPRFWKCPICDREYRSVRNLCAMGHCPSVIDALKTRKELDPDAPDVIVFPDSADGDLIDRVLHVMGNPSITETTYAKLKVVLAGKAYTVPLDDYVTLLERNNGRLREVLKEALEQTGCDGDLCLYRWHEKARALLGE